MYGMAIFLSWNIHPVLYYFVLLKANLDLNVVVFLEQLILVGNDVYLFSSILIILFSLSICQKGE